MSNKRSLKTYVLSPQDTKFNSRQQKLKSPKTLLNLTLNAIKMKVFLLVFCSILLMDCQYQSQTEKYPLTERSMVEDHYFGKKINDPYRWLENDTSSATMDWVDRQNDFTDRHLSEIKDKNAIRSRLKDLWTYERQSIPYKSGGFFIYRKNDGTQDQSVYYYKKGKEGKEQLLIDPNTLSEDGTVTVSGFKV